MNVVLPSCRDTHGSHGSRLLTQLSSLLSTGPSGAPSVQMQSRHPRSEAPERTKTATSTLQQSSAEERL